MRPEVMAAKTHKRVIVLDPGHGGHDSGAKKFGTVEKNVVLAFGKMLRNKLKRRYKVLMTRDDDTFVSLDERRRFAERDHGPGPVAGRGGYLGVWLALVPTAEKEDQRLIERRDRGYGRGDVRGLGIVHPPDAAALRHGLQPVGQTTKAPQRRCEGVRIGSREHGCDAGGEHVRQIVPAQQRYVGGLGPTLGRAAFPQAAQDPAVCIDPGSEGHRSPRGEQVPDSRYPGRHVEDRGVVPSGNGVFEALRDREDVHTTALGDGVAVPHAVIPTLQDILLVVATAAQAVPFGPPETDPVDVLFTLLSPPGREAEHIKLLARICRLVRHPGLLESMRAAPGPEALYEAILAVDSQHV